MVEMAEEAGRDINGKESGKEENNKEAGEAIQEKDMQESGQRAGRSRALAAYLCRCGIHSVSRQPQSSYSYVMIPGSKGLKSDAGLPARGFLNLGPAKNMKKQPDQGGF